jgi:hypothetical protein
MVDLPVALSLETLEQRSFWGPDLRGPAWVKEHKMEDPLFRLLSWKPDRQTNQVTIEVALFLQPRHQLAEEDATGDDPLSILCPSWIYGLPSSFFTQPIAVCAPSMLDFFAI